MAEKKTWAVKELRAIIQSQFSGGIKVDLGAPDPIEICGRT
jgi:hypothetical protein